MIDTKVKVNGKTVAEYDLIKEPNVKTINGEGPDDKGNVEVESGGPTIKGGYDLEELFTAADETIAPNQYEFSEDIMYYIPTWLFNNAGKTIYVTYDGILYECLVKTPESGCVTIGDPTFEQYPFYYFNNITLDATSEPLVLSDPSVSHTIKIELYKITPVVFDKKYIPDLKTLTDSVYFKGKFLVVNSNGFPKWTDFKDVPVDYAVIKSSTEGSSKKFKITVDDSGTISATEITE